MNIEAGGVSAELKVVRSEFKDLGEGLRRVEEEVERRRREREREIGARVADLHTEAIRLRRELEVLSPHQSSYNNSIYFLKRQGGAWDVFMKSVLFLLLSLRFHIFICFCPDQEQTKLCPELQTAVYEGNSGGEKKRDIQSEKTARGAVT